MYKGDYCTIHCVSVASVGHLSICFSCLTILYVCLIILYVCLGRGWHVYMYTCVHVCALEIGVLFGGGEGLCFLQILVLVCVCVYGVFLFCFGLCFDLLVESVEYSIP